MGVSAMYETLILGSFFRATFERNQDRIAVADDDTGRCYTYGELIARARRVAAYLTSCLNLHRGDRVALYARNGVWSLDLFYAMSMTGCILTTYNYMLREHELMGLLRQEAPRVVFYESGYARQREIFQHILPDTHFVVLDGEGSSVDPSYGAEVLCGPNCIADPVPLSPEAICMLMHTGGTTGIPKAAKLSYRSIMCNAVGQVINYGICEQDVAYVSFPFFHCAAWNAALPVLLCGGRVVLKKKFQAEECLEMISRLGLTLLAGAPSIFRRMAHLHQFEETDFSSVRGIRCGSAPPTLELMRRYWGKGLPFYNGYGMTEAGPGILALSAGSMSLELATCKAGSVGKPMLFTQLRIVDEDGNDLPVGAEGELLIQSGSMFSGYWGNEAETAQVMRDGWLHTGDVARRDADGFYFICGRKKHMYISGGENIYPVEIETVLLDQPNVEDAYVFGVPDDDLGEVGKAIVVPHKRKEVSKQLLLCALSRDLSTLKRPKYIQFVDQIPRSESGKILGETVLAEYHFPGDIKC